MYEKFLRELLSYKTYIYTDRRLQEEYHEFFILSIHVLIYK